MQAHRVIDSEPLEPLGELTGELHAQLEAAVGQTLIDPAFYEVGRLSTRVSFQDDEGDSLFHDLARAMSENFLGRPVRPQTTATISVVTDGATFRGVTFAKKAATKWHQDSTINPGGFFHLPDDVERIILPMQTGPLYVEGESIVADGIVPVFDDSLSVRENRIAALAQEGNLFGTDGVLVRSVERPIGAEIIEAEPDIVYRVPRSSVHETNPDIDTGRVFYFLDH